VRPDDDVELFLQGGADELPCREKSGGESDHVAGFIPHLRLLAHGCPAVLVVEAAEVPHIVRTAHDHPGPVLDFRLQSRRGLVRMTAEEMGHAGHGDEFAHALAFGDERLIPVEIGDHPTHLFCGGLKVTVG